MKVYPQFLRCSSRTLVLFFLTISSQVLAQNQVPISVNAAERFVTVGNHKLFLSITGDPNAKMTVVFESGAGSGAQVWNSVRGMMPANIRTIAYDRAGLGKSEKGPLPQTMAQNVFELHGLLNAAGVKGPIILVGQSIGGLIVRMYTEQYPKEVAGLVLVDPTHPSSVLGSMKYGGWVRLREKATGKTIPKPQVKDSISPGYDSTADYMAEEFHKLFIESQKNPRQLGNRPVVILGAGVRKQPPGTPDEQWKQIRAERDKQLESLTAISTNSRYILDPASSHSIQNDNPAIVVKSIQMVIDSLISKKRL